jgi:hypothetical protein
MQEMRPGTGKETPKDQRIKSKIVIKHGVDRTAQEVTKYDL